MEALVTDAELSIVLAFAQVMDQKRELGDLLGWRITRDPKGCIVEIMTVEGRPFAGVAATFDEARRVLSNQMIGAALEGDAHGMTWKRRTPAANRRRRHRRENGWLSYAQWLELHRPHKPFHPRKLRVVWLRVDFRGVFESPGTVVMEL